MNLFNNSKLAAKKKAGVNIHLYSDDHPETTLKGTGFKDAETAQRILDLVKQKPRNRQVWTINAMYHRAKHHPSQTETMWEAMAIYDLQGMAWPVPQRKGNHEGKRGRQARSRA
jgi:hypothetical protein